MGKNILETVLPIAAAGLGAGAFGMGPLAGVMQGAAGIAPAASPAFGAFGSADMMASLAPGSGLLGEVASTALPSLLGTEAPIPFGPNMAEMADGSLGMKLEASGMTPNSFTGGYDSLNGLQRFGQQLTGGLDQMNMNPLRMTGMGQPQPQPSARPPSMQKPQNQPETQVAMPYGQTISGGIQLTDEQKRMLMERMRGQNGLIG